MTPSLSGHVGGLTRGKSAAEALPDHVVVHARHDPPWATAAAVEEAEELDADLGEHWAEFRRHVISD